jgi:hypothetical protein
VTLPVTGHLLAVAIVYRHSITFQTNYACPFRKLCIRRATPSISSSVPPKSVQVMRPSYWSLQNRAMIAFACFTVSTENTGRALG